MISKMIPFFSAITAAVIAQILKPFLMYLFTHKWNWKKMFDAGGFPSSHSALVTALSLSVGFEEKFSSTIFAVTISFAVIVIYDATHVRYYSGQTARVTQQLVKDLQEEEPSRFISPVYDTKLREVLGHNWKEAIGGMILGALIALFYEYFFAI
jgi:acid phosphatase family membrane protein YuiD